MGRFSVRSPVHLSVRLSPPWAIQPGLRPSQPGLRSSQPGLRPSQPGLRPSQPASQVSGFRDGWLGLWPGWLGLGPGWRAQRGGTGWMDVRTDGKSLHSTGLCPLSGSLPKKLVAQKSPINLSFLTHLMCGQGAYIHHLGPWVTPSES